MSQTEMRHSWNQVVAKKKMCRVIYTMSDRKRKCLQNLEVSEEGPHVSQRGNQIQEGVKNDEYAYHIPYPYATLVP